MTDLRKAAKMALEALLTCDVDYDYDENPYNTFDAEDVSEAIEALRQALQRPVKSYTNGEPQYATDNPMTDLRKAAERLLEALDDGWVQRDDWVAFALRQALEQAEYDKLTIKFGERAKEYLEGAKKNWDTSNMAHRTGGLSVEQEPIAWLSNPNFIEQETVEGRPRRVWFECNAGVGIPFYTAPPSKPWVGLSDMEAAIYGDQFSGTRLVREIEGLLRERNT